MKKFGITVFSVLCLIITSLGCFYAAGIYKGMFEINTRETEYHTFERSEGANFNLLLLGREHSGYNTDVILLFSINSDENKMSVLSIPRDTQVSVSGKYYKINAVSSVFGMDRLIVATEDLTGAKIHYYASLSLSSFRDIVDALGGVTFDVPIDMNYKDPYQDLVISLKKGEQLLLGSEAEQLIRYRKYPNGDIDRIQVQQDFLKALFNQKLAAGGGEGLFKAYLSIRDELKTNYSVFDLFSHQDALKKAFKNLEAEFFTLPGGAQMISGRSFFVTDPEETKELVSEHFSH